MKKLLSIIFVLSMCMTATTASAEAMETQEVSDKLTTQESDESATDAEISNETPTDTENNVTFDGYYEMLDTVIKYKMKQTGAQCILDDYNISYEQINDKYVFVEIADKETEGCAQRVVKRDKDVVWLQDLFTTEYIVYGDKTVYTAGELYELGELTLEEFKKVGGAYYCDINNNDIVDVNDVTQLQLFLADIKSDAEENSDVFYDVNFDEYVDVSDATKVQMYVAGYEDIPCYGHNVVTKDYKEATCISKGYTGDRYCEDCQKLVRSGTDIIEDKTKHISTEIRNVKEPTTESEGYTGDSCCTACNAVITKGEPIEKLPSPEEEMEEVEQLIFGQINEERKAAGLKPVKWDDEIASASEIRAQEFTDWCHGDSANRKAHQRPNGKEWHDVLSERYTLCGEILAASNIKENLVSLWMDSSVHREVILTGKYTHISVGIVKVKEENGIEMYYACVIFRADKL